MVRIFKWFTLPDAQARIVWFSSGFSDVSFEGADKMLALYLNYCADLNISAQKGYLETFLKTEGKKLIKEYSVRIDTMGPVDYDEPGSLEEAYRVIAAATIARYDQCIEVDLSERIFKVDMRAFMQEQIGVELQRLMAESYPKIATGCKGEDLILDMQAKLSKIQESYSDEVLEDLDFLEGRTYKKGDSTGMRFLFKTQLPCIDGDLGGVFTKQVQTITGQPGGGKTRLAAVHYAYRAAVDAKLDVLFDELELTEQEVENILIAYHIAKIFNGKIKIPDSCMNKNELSPEQRRYYEAAKADLFESGKYGKIVIRTKDLYIETMRRSRMQYFRLNRGTQVWIVDYLGLVQSRPQEKYAKQKVKWEIITDAIKILKDVAKKADIAVICLNQFNDDGIKAIAQGKQILPGMVEGGHVIQRHSDYDIAMTYTEEQKVAQMRMFSTIKIRGASGFSNVPYATDLSISIFKQMNPANMT